MIVVSEAVRRLKCLCHLSRRIASDTTNPCRDAMPVRSSVSQNGLIFRSRRLLEVGQSQLSVDRVSLLR